MKSRSRLIGGIIVASLLGSILAIAASPAHADRGLGGGATFLNGAVFPFISGTNSSLESAFYVQNIGDEAAELELYYTELNGISITPVEGQETVLEPGESTFFRFVIEVGELVPAGQYPVTLNLRERVEVDPEQRGSTYIPALAAKFTVDVIGASATANISAISELNGLPAIGTLSLYYLAENGTDTLVKQERTSEFIIRLVPGNYRLFFDIPNLQRQSIDFAIADGETIDVVLEIPTIEFVDVAAEPTRDDRDVIQFVTLSMDVFNNLRPVEGPVELFARINLNGEFIEDFPIETLPSLPEGETFQRATYNPDSGFSQGNWEFEFFISNPEFIISADNVIRVGSPGLLQSYIREIMLGLAILIIVGLLIPRKWWVIILRRKKKKEKTSKPESAKPEPELVGVGASLPTRSKSQLDEKPKTNSGPKFPEINLPKLPEINVPRIDVAAPFRRLEESLRALMAGKPKDPLSAILEIRREIEELENQGMKTKAFNYDLDAVFALQGEPALNRSQGKPYSKNDIQAITEYKSLKQKLDEIETPDLRSQANKILLEERISRRSSGSIGGAD